MKNWWSSQQVVTTLRMRSRTSSTIAYVRIGFWFSDCFDARILFVFLDNRRTCVLMRATHSFSECHQYVWHAKGLWELIKVTGAWRARRSNPLPGFAMFVSWWLQNVREGRGVCSSSEVRAFLSGFGYFWDWCECLFQFHFTFIWFNSWFRHQRKSCFLLLIFMLF